MKNRHIEKLIKQSKRYAKTAANDRRWNKDLGIKVYHCYDEKKRYSWWDDFAFMHGSQQIVVWFVHPRYEYNKTMDDLAHKMVDPIPSEPGDIFTGSTPTYKYLGKNKKRKKVAYWTMPPISDESREYYAKWMDLTSHLCKTSNYAQGCFIKIKQYNYCRGVELCVPVEVFGESDLVTLKNIVIHHLNDPTYFERSFGSYKYTSVNWNEEDHP